MDSSQLTPRQARELHRRLTEMLGFLNRLLRRMEQRGFPQRDPLYLASVDARDKLHDLCVKVHLLSCEGGVWDGKRSGR